MHDVAKGQNSHLKIWNEPRIELQEADKFGNIVNHHRRRPVGEQLMFRHSRLVAIWAYIDTDEMDPLGKDGGFL
jgi:hypothetical protein